MIKKQTDLWGRNKSKKHSRETTQECLKEERKKILKL